MRYCLDHTGEVYGDKGQIQVLEWVCRNTYRVTCSICAKDPELHGDATYLISVSRLRRGGYPCGCSKKPEWTPEQYVVRLRRACFKAGYTIRESELAKVRNKSSLINVSCEKHKYGTWQTSVSEVLLYRGCKYCTGENISKSKIVEDDVRISQFFNTGKFKDGTVFCKEYHKHRKSATWYYKCAVCSSDEYVKAGLCSGVFSTTCVSLISGCMPCRCTSSFAWTKEQREYQIINADHTKSNNYSFLGWEDGYNGSGSRIIMECPDHDPWVIAVNNYVNSGRTCPYCAEYGYCMEEDGYVYVLRIKSNEGSYHVGYGISNTPERRFNDHRRNLELEGFIIVDYRLFKTSGKMAREVESQIIKKYESCGIPVTGFRKECTSIENWSKILQDIFNMADLVEVFL